MSQNYLRSALKTALISSFIFAASPFCLPTPAFAIIDGGGIGNLSDYLQCNSDFNSQQAVEFVIRSTAAPTYIQGVLTWSSRSFNNPVVFNCVKNQTPFAVVDANSSSFNATSDSSILIWDCKEIRVGTDEGAMKVQILQDPSSSNINGILTMNQIFPLQPQLIGTLNCRSPEDL